MGIDITGYVEIKRGASWHCVQEDWPSPGCRHSLLFAFLGHRHSGYAGFPRIAEARGMPTDLSPEVRAASDLWDEDDYFYPSWLTLGELLRYDYERVVARRRVITVTEEGGELSYLTPERDDEGEWKDFTLAEEIGGFPELFRQMREEWGDPENVRVVFWFDQDWTASQSTAMRSGPMRSDGEIQRLRARWEEQRLLFHQATREDWPNQDEVYGELRRRGRQMTARWEQLFDLDR